MRGMSWVGTRSSREAGVGKQRERSPEPIFRDHDARVKITNDPPLVRSVGYQPAYLSRAFTNRLIFFDPIVSEFAPRESHFPETRTIQALQRNLITHKLFLSDRKGQNEKC
jgi:hypothetical protein